MCGLVLPPRGILILGALGWTFFAGFFLGLYQGIQGTGSRIQVHAPPLEGRAAVLPSPSLSLGAASASMFRVVETAVADDPSQSSAVVQDIQTGTLSECRTGARLGEGRVLVIERMRVVLDVQGKRAVLSDETPGHFRRTFPVDPARLGLLLHKQRSEQVLADPSEPGLLVFHVSEKVHRHLQDPIWDSLVTDARIVPSFHPSGFKLFSVRPGSSYALLGLRNGDVIQRINGRELDTPDKCLEAYAKVKEAKVGDVEIERSGQPIKYRYVLESP